ncbi:MAG: hypothetical protein CME65_00270 [Halobacteriovoraceae bacterium]|nr:hypothetical protein [Halobacteriovoraceae bacterium]|tara:strand:+ start:1054 stop:1233 length:180 start_codon:yes stop_codon:yes gene_type:complete
MKTNENLSPKKSTEDATTKTIQLNVAPSKSVRPQKSMVRVKSVRPNRATGSDKIRIKRY